jgi:hypothetical protein
MAGAILLAAAPAAAAPRLAPEAQLERAIEGRQAGQAIDCINLRYSGSTQIIDRSAIVYRSGGTLYVNRPSGGAQALNSWDALVTRTQSSQLCSGDAVEIMDIGTNTLRGIVILGEFVPYNRNR